MIKGLLLGIAIFAVLWLALWMMRADAGRQGRWAPFDMREPDRRPDASPTSRGRRVPPGRTRRSR